MHNAFGDAAHDFRLRRFQRRQGSLLVTFADGFFDLADKAANTGLARRVDGGALGRGADALAGRGNIRHGVSLAKEAGI